MHKIYSFFISTAFMFISITATEAVEYRFASAEEAAEILAAQEDYFNRMSPAEIAIRMNSETPDKTPADLIAHYRANVMDFSDAEKAQFQTVIDETREGMGRVSHLLPEVIYLIRANNKIEGGFPHTHANAIIVQTTYPELTADLLYHETFHVLSRNQLARHASLYGLLGFQACNLVEPPLLLSMRLTNPDVPVMGYYLPVEQEGEEIKIMPFLYASRPAYDPAITTGFGGHFGFGLMQVEVTDGACIPHLATDGGPVLLSPGNVPGFFGAIGNNTGYIIHAEEVLADNFKFLMTGKSDLPNPEILERLNAWLMEGK